MANTDIVFGQTPNQADITERTDLDTAMMNLSINIFVLHRGMTDQSRRKRKRSSTDEACQPDQNVGRNSDHEEGEVVEDKKGPSNRRDPDPASVRTVRTVRNTYEKGNIDTTWDEWEVGDIIRMPQVVPQLYDGITRPSDKAVESDKFGRILLKERACIVLGVFPRSLLVLPILTSNGEGIGAKHKILKLTGAVLIEENTRWKPGPTKNRLVVVRRRGYDVPEQAYVQLTGFFTISYSLPLVKLGRLRTSSTSRLQRMMQECLDIGMFSKTRDFRQFDQEWRERIDEKIKDPETFTPRSLSSQARHHEPGPGITRREHSGASNRTSLPSPGYHRFIPQPVSVPSKGPYSAVAMSIDQMERPDDRLASLEFPELSY